MAPDRLTRRATLAGGTALLASLAGCPTDSDPSTGGATATPTATRGRSTDAGEGAEVGASPVATGLTAPVAVVTPRAGRHLIADQPGRVVLAADGDTRTVLDLRDRVVDVGGYDERGLLGVAHHPDFDANGRLFVRYSAPPRDGTPQSYDHTFVLSEFSVDPESFEANPATERTILEIPQPQSNHNAGDLAFGPDGLLYVPVGDGGGANDRGAGHVEDWYEAVPGGNGQDVTENLLGSVLRIDVDDGASATPRTGGGTAADSPGDRPYGVPEDNPLVGADGLDEHYAWGFRNPWRLSFGPDGRLFVGDVGQDRFEEVDVVERGGNYGWNVREGAACFRAEECPTVTPDGRRLREPILTYPQEGAEVSGIAVIGGHLYDGDAISGLRGRYVFGDWQMNGRLFLAREADERPWPTSTLRLASEEVGSLLLSFGLDADGELLVGTTNNPGVGGETGGVFRLTPP